MVKTSLSNFPTQEGYGFNPCLGSQDPTCLMAKKPEHRQQKQYCNKLNKDFKNGPHQKKTKTKQLRTKKGQE